MTEYFTAREGENLQNEMKTLNQNVWLGFESLHTRMNAEQAAPGTIARGLNSRFTTALVTAVIAAMGLVGAAAYAAQNDRIDNLKTVQSGQIVVNKEQCEFNNKLRQARIDGLRRNLDLVVNNPKVKEAKKRAAQDYYDAQRSAIPAELSC